MSNISQEEMQKRGELVKRARQILVQEFTAMRNQQHQQWLRDSADNWKNKGILIAYPPAKMYPTEQEVVDKALDLYNRSMQPAIQLPDPPPPIEQIIPPMSSTPIDDSTPTLMQDSQTPSIREQLQSAYNAPVPSSIMSTDRITVLPPSHPTITRLVEANGDFVIIHDPINLDNSVPIVESKIKEPEPEVKVPIEEPKADDDKTEEPADETKTEESAPAKHSLLRSVLSGWLSKNADKDKK
jgi:hypothetical protein